MLGQVRTLLAPWELMLAAVSQEVVQTSDIKGEKLPMKQVRSSVARRLGVIVPDPVPACRDVEGIVEMVVDATQNYLHPVTEERL